MKNQNAYTDAPELHPNLFLGSLHLLFWLFVHPSAWRAYVKRIDPRLEADFCLLELNREQFKSAALQRVLVMIYLVWPLWAALGGGVVLFFFETHTKELLFYSVFYGYVFGMTISVVMSTMVSVATSVLLYIAIGLTIGLTFEHVILGGGIVQYMLVVAVSIALEMAPRILRTSTSFAKRIGGFVLGGFLGTLIVGAVYALTLSMTGRLSDALSTNIISYLISNLILGTISGIFFGLVAFLRARHRRRSLWIGGSVSLISSVSVALSLSLTPSPTLETVPHYLYTVPLGIILGFWTASLFVVPYILGTRIAGPSVGAIASLLSGGLVLILAFLILDWPFGWPILLAYLASTLLGVTHTIWRPLLLYPFVAAWNTWLYRADERREATRPALLRWHSAFWDEHQRLPLGGLEDHLVLVAERNPLEGQAAIEYLSTSRQAWAATAGQIELDARRLERYANVEAISQASSHLAAGELEGPASALLRSFSRISQDVKAALQHTNRYHQRLALSITEEQLDGLLRELTRSSEQYGVRFRPIATHWRQIVADHLRTLTENAERSQEIDNPYIFGVPVGVHEELFVGRTDISARIEHLLLDRRHPPLLLYGQRRMGKTSLLDNLSRLLPSTIIPLLVDGERLSGARHLPSLLHSMANQMIKSAKRRRQLILPPLSREQVTAYPLTSFNEWLDEIEETLEGRQLALLAIDEFEVLLNILEQEPFDSLEFLRMVRHLIQHRPRFKVLLAGSHTLEEFHRWSSHLINIQIIKLSYLQKSEALKLIEQPVKGFPLRYEPQASQQLYHLTRGYPHLVQLLCYELVEHKNAQPLAQRRHVSSRDVELIIPKALETGSFFFVDIEENQVSTDGLPLLRYLAAQGEGAIVGGEQLARDCPREEIEAILKQLLQRDLIEAVKGGYRFQVELIRRWFARGILV